jgi:hypothetical protein
MTDEELGRMVNDVCNGSEELRGTSIEWDDHAPEDQAVAIRIGRTLFNVGRQSIDLCHVDKLGDYEPCENLAGDYVDMLPVCRYHFHALHKVTK